MDEDDGGDWEEMDNEQTKQLIREKRREMRHMRQKYTKDKYPQMTNHISNNGINASKVIS